MFIIVNPKKSNEIRRTANIAMKIAIKRDETPLLLLVNLLRAGILLANRW